MSTRARLVQDTRVRLAGEVRGRLSLELRIIGPAAIAAALAMPVAGAVLMAVLAGTGHPHAQLDRLSAVLLEALCPLGTALAAVSVVGRDPAAELVLTTPARYRRVLLGRAGLAAGLAAAATLALAVALFAAGLWPAGQGGSGLVLIWGPPALWLTGTGLLAAIADRGPALASGALAAVWLAEAIFAGQAKASSIIRDQYLFATVSHLPPGAWAENRAGLAVVGTAALALAAALLSSPARLLTAEPS
jgi:hypothetical protein